MVVICMIVTGVIVFGCCFCKGLLDTLVDREHGAAAIGSTNFTDVMWKDWLRAFGARSCLNTRQRIVRATVATAAMVVTTGWDTHRSKVGVGG